MVVIFDRMERWSNKRLEIERFECDTRSDAVDWLKGKMTGWMNDDDRLTWSRTNDTAPALPDMVEILTPDGECTDIVGLIVFH